MAPYTPPHKRRYRGQVELINEEGWRGASEVHIRPESGESTVTLSYSRKRGDYRIGPGAFITFQQKGEELLDPQRWRVMAGLVCFIEQSVLESYDEVVDANIQHFESPNMLLLRLPSSTILEEDRKEVALAALENNQRLCDYLRSKQSGAELGLNLDFNQYITQMKHSPLADMASDCVFVLSQVNEACPSFGYDCDDVVGMVGYGEVGRQDFQVASIWASCMSAAIRVTAEESKLVVPNSCVREDLTLKMESLHSTGEEKTVFMHACFIGSELTASFLDGKVAFRPHE